MSSRQEEGLVPMRVVDAGTGEINEISPFPHLPDETPITLQHATWDGTINLSEAQETALRGPANEEQEIDILPSGEVYMSHVFVRRRLNDAFMREGGWKLRPVSKISIDPETNVMYREYALVVNGVAIAAAYGSTKYQPSNKRMDFADAAEAVRSNALTRLAKDLGVGSECWDRDWCEAWKDRHACHVWVMVKAWDPQTRSRGEKKEHHWRKLSRKPFYGEFDVVPDSPNYAKAKEQQAAYKRMLQERQGTQKVKASDQPVQEQQKTGGESTTSRAKEPAKDTRRTTATPPAQTVTIPPNERGFYIREVRASKDQKKPHQIVMMDGTTFFTYHKSYLAELQKAWAERKRVRIETESVRSGNFTYPHITEFKVG